MKYALVALAATALASGVSASANNHRRHNHAEIFKRNKAASNDCNLCTTYVTSRVVPVTVYADTAAEATVTVAPVYQDEVAAASTVHVTNVNLSTAVAYVSKTLTGAAPVPEVTTIAEPGTYTIPAKTLIITETKTAICESTTALASGSHTYGGVTTTITDAPVTVTVPYVVSETPEGTTISKIYETVYICPTPDTYTIGAITTAVPQPTTVTYGVPSVYLPGTYVQPEITTTITKTLQVVYCPYTSVAEVEAPAPTKVQDVHVPAKETPAVVVPVKETPAVVVPVKQTPAKVVPVKSPVKSVVAVPVKATNPKASTGKYWAITYSVFSDDVLCKESAVIDAEIADIAARGFSNVRVYSTGCKTLEYVGSACKTHGVGLIIGIFLKAGGVSTGADQVTDLIAWKGWSIVSAVIVGNEAVFNGFITASDLAVYINFIRDQLKSKVDYHGPVSTTETVNIIQANSVLCDAMDFVGVNIQPFFDGGVAADNAGVFLASQLKLAEDACGGKDAYILEAGWPSRGTNNNKAIASPEEQRKAVLSFETAAPGRVAFFTYSNDIWKKAGADNIETNFGCGSLL